MSRPSFIATRMGAAFIFAIVLIAPSTLLVAQPDSVRYSKTSIGGVTAHVVNVDLNDPEVRVSPCLARWYPGTSESFRSFTQRTRPAAAINGTYFGFGSLKPVGDVVVGGKLAHFGGIGTVFRVDGQGGASIAGVPRGQFVDWTGSQSVLGAGPRLVEGGRAVYSIGAARAEGFRDPAILKRAARRSALGLTAGNHLLLVVVPQPVTLTRMAMVMRGLGCRDAINLDGGSSSGLYHQGRMLTTPGRRLTNCLVVYADPASFASGAGELAPPDYLDPTWLARVRGERPPITGPAVCFDRPEAGDTLRGMIEVTARAQGTTDGRYALFYVDGALKGMSNVTPYRCQWRTDEHTDGAHTIAVEVIGENREVVARSELRVLTQNREQTASR